MQCNLIVTISCVCKVEEKLGKIQPSEIIFCPSVIILCPRVIIFCPSVKWDLLRKTRGKDNDEGNEKYEDITIKYDNQWTTIYAGVAMLIALLVIFIRGWAKAMWQKMIMNDEIVRLQIIHIGRETKHKFSRIK